MAERDMIKIAQCAQEQGVETITESCESTRTRTQWRMLCSIWTSKKQSALIVRGEVSTWMGGSGAEGVYECRSCDELCSRSAQLLISVSLPAMVTTLKHAPVPQKPHQLPWRFQNCTKAGTRMPDQSTIQAAPRVQFSETPRWCNMNSKWPIS